MNKPSAKAEFSNDQLGQLLEQLREDGCEKVIYDILKKTLTIHGDLITDIDGFDFNVTVIDGAVRSNIDISGGLELRASDPKFNSDLKIMSDAGETTSISADSIFIDGDQGAIMSAGEIRTKHGISSKVIYPAREGLYIQSEYSIRCNIVQGPVKIDGNVIARKEISNATINGVVNCAGTVKNSKIISDGVCGIHTISDGSEVFVRELRFHHIGGLNPDERPVTVAVTDGFEDLQFVTNDRYVHNAEIYVPRSDVFDDNIHIIQIEGREKLAVVYDDFGKYSPELQDLIRLGYCKTKQSMPKRMSDQINKMALG